MYLPYSRDRIENRWFLHAVNDAMKTLISALTDGVTRRANRFQLAWKLRQPAAPDRRVQDLRGGAFTNALQTHSNFLLTARYAPHMVVAIVATFPARRGPIRVEVHHG